MLGMGLSVPILLPNGQGSGIFWPCSSRRLELPYPNHTRQVLATEEQDLTRRSRTGVHSSVGVDSGWQDTRQYG